MQDGQNLFDVATSYAAEWGIDEAIENLVEENQTEGVIVVGIENGGTLRVNEYIPWEFDYNGDIIGGEGDEYVDFMVNTLKPYMDANYRTLSDRDNTGIGGSSLGALISLYAAMKYQETFGRVCAMSSSFWVADNAMLTYLNSITKELEALIYLDMGQLEGQDAVNDMEDVYNKLLLMGYTQDQINMVIDEDGQHSETYWRERFPSAFLWLYE
jgi:metallo-beta-lactamase class B